MVTQVQKQLQDNAVVVHWTSYWFVYNLMVAHYMVNSDESVEYVDANFGW